MRTFKVGDKVYYPSLSKRVLTLVQSKKSMNLLAIERVNDSIDLTKSGKRWDAPGAIPDIVHATPENHAMLEQLYGLEFEKPVISSNSEKLIIAMLERGDGYVPCWLVINAQNLTMSIQ